MGCFVNPMGSYYQGDRAHALDIEVPDRPSPLYVWADGQWALDAAAQAKAQRASIDASQVGDCQLDATVMGLVNQTRAEWRAWAGANFPSLTAPERTRLGDLFWVVSLGVRRVVRA